MKNQAIRTHYSVIYEKATAEEEEIRGMLQGEQTYLYFRFTQPCWATLSGQRLYRLAKAIVRRFEEDK